MVCMTETNEHGDEIVEDLTELGYSEKDIADLAAMNDRQNRELIRPIIVGSYADSDGAVGSRETWIVGSTKTDDDKPVTFRLDAGAGLGHTHLSLLVDVDGERVAYEFIDVGELAEAWARQIVATRDVAKLAGELGDDLADTDRHDGKPWLPGDL